MRFGGLIAAAAWILAITGAGAQTPNAGAAQTPNSEQQANQPEQIHNPEAEAQKAQEKAEQANPTNKTAPTAEQEREQKIRQYDPLANEGPQQNGRNPQTQNPNGQGAGAKGGSRTGNSDSTAKSGDENAEGGPPGPAVDGEGDSSADSSGYSGPAVLSRSYTLLRPSMPTQEKWNPFLGINGIYDSGIQGIQSTSGA